MSMNNFLYYTLYGSTNCKVAVLLGDRKAKLNRTHVRGRRRRHFAAARE